MTKKILLNPDTSKISRKFLRDGAEVLALPLRNVINLLIKQSTFPEERKIPKLEPIFKEGASLLLLVSKIIENLFHFQIEDY